MIGRTLSHYRIHAALGAGGMGEVYRATDTKLGRDVALKVLPQDVASDPERLARFQREARAVAALNHPNVVTLYSVEESEGVHFLTMELIEGQSLDRLISSNGLPAERVIEIAGAMAEALSAAHEKGIVHRDLKPANVMVTNDGRVKVLDFGLAKDVGAETSTDATLTSAGHTQAGVVMGTPAYMSPEQVSGRTLDHRTDIFSLGVLLYEMSAGHRPFEGTSSAELISSILRDSPPSITDLRPELPADLSRIIRRCLEKDPRYRMQTARDVSNEFRDMARMIPRPPASTSSARTTAAADSGVARAGFREDEGFWVAVLPFKYSGASTSDLAALAEGLSDEIITGLSRFSYLRVIARSSTASYASQAADVRGAGKDLNARYVMEGTLRQAGSKVRISVQLLDTLSGAHLWAENYERVFSAEIMFELQDDLVARIVSTVADMNGVLPRSMSEAVRNKNADQLGPYGAVLRSFAYPQRGTPEELTAARSGLEAALRKAPGYADAWAMLSFLSGQDYIHGFELQADSYDAAFAAARRAVDLAPSNHLAYFSLAQSLWYQKDYDSFRDAAERAVALNPMDGNSVAFMGELLTYTGNEERGMELAGRAKRMNPNHPGWYWCADFYQAFSRGDYRKAISFGQKAKLQGFPLAPMFIATACGQLGDLEGGARAAADLVKFRPELPAIMRKQVAKVWNTEYGERFLEGLRKAGLEIPAVPAATEPEQIGARTVSGESRTTEGFWVAVLPFRYAGGNADLKALADGLSEEVITGLSRFSYLRVIARGSTTKYSSESGDVRAIGKQLGARYVMEASLRQAGSKLRLAVQLVDSISGAHLWAETYERAFTPESVFELQDDLVPRIVATVADQYGVLPRSMSELLRSKSEDTLTPHEAVLRAFSYFRRITPEEHAAVRNILERAVKQSPDHADSWAMLSMMYRGEFAQGFNPRPDPLDRALDAARRALELAPNHALGHYALATVYFFRKDKTHFRVETERVLSLNPNDAAAKAYLGFLMAALGEWERGCQMVESAMQLNPNCPGYFYFARCVNSYRLHKYEEALEGVARINMPGYFHAPAIQAAALGQLGRYDEASKALQDLLALRPNFGAEARQEYAKLYDDEHAGHIIDGLRKAGLEIADDPVKAAAVTSGANSVATGSGASRPAVREDEGFWVAVLPFKYIGANADLNALADGLTDDIITGMSRFSYLRVISRSSTVRYAEKALDVRAAAQELRARYVMEGSIRQAGAKIRIAVQLVDAASGTSLWAETYDRPFSPETTLDLLDDVVPRIVATVGDTQGILAHNMTEALRNRDPESLTPYEALLRSFGFHQHVNAAEQLAGRTALERAVKQVPDCADYWAMLSWLYRSEHSHGHNPLPDPLGRSLAAARRAVDLAPSSQLPHAALASAFFFRRELDSFRTAAERALPLNRMEGYVTAFMGMLTAFSGDWERGCALVERSTQLNPNHPGWYWLPLALNAYRQEDGKHALEYVLKVNMPGLWLAQITVVLVYSQLGKTDRAGAALRDLLAVRPDLRTNLREELGKWWQPEMIEQMVGDLRKAGLEIAGE